MFIGKSISSKISQWHAPLCLLLRRLSCGIHPWNSVAAWNYEQLDTHGGRAQEIWMLWGLTCQDVASLSWRNCNNLHQSQLNKPSWFQTTLSSQRPLQDTTGSWNHLYSHQSLEIFGWSTLGPVRPSNTHQNSLRVCICSRKTNPLENEWNPPSTSRDDFLNVALSETWLPRTELVTTRVVHHMFQIAKNIGVHPQIPDTQISYYCECNVSH